MSWGEGSLLAAPEIAVKGFDRPFLIFIDGLDEYQGDKTYLILLVKRLSSARDMIKICLSSRFDGAIETSFKTASFLVMHHVNKAAIQAFCTSFLHNMIESRDLRTESIIERWAPAIAERAQGDFLWADFAI